MSNFKKVYNIFILYLYICTKYLSTSDIRLFLLHRCYLVVIKNIVLLLYYCTSCSFLLISIILHLIHDEEIFFYWPDVEKLELKRLFSHIHSCKKCIIFHFGWINKIMYIVLDVTLRNEKSVILLV